MNLAKVLLSILLFICLLDLPYGYYQFVRVVGMVSFGVFAYVTYKNEGLNLLFVVFAFLAILFQPLFKISLGRSLWNIVDVITGIFLLTSIFISRNK